MKTIEVILRILSAPLVFLVTILIGWALLVFFAVFLSGMWVIGIFHWGDIRRFFTDEDINFL